MLNRISFDNLKNKLIDHLAPYYNLNAIQQTIANLKAVEYENDNPKNSYKMLSNILENQPMIPIPTNSNFIASFSALISTPPEMKANQALASATKKAKANYTAAWIQQDCLQGGIPINFADTIIVNNLNTEETTPVVTKLI